ncbi:hypothetical protein BJ875DRAFT_284691 [Amylocarpus encephaloides]|uniref:Prenylcysteine lyase domain-containing protein n=1 Tax=Amylocarpus encephaloides TaxID=45428 RepID=A0A9P7YJN8_9HELO|nr:hypothetical protein BJ875DRAFT_284691 [Amylocarpus encephaloides]
MNDPTPPPPPPPPPYSERTPLFSDRSSRPPSYRCRWDDAGHASYNECLEQSSQPEKNRNINNILKKALGSVALAFALVFGVIWGFYGVAIWWDGGGGKSVKGVDVVRVGVVGAGPAGINAAYALSKHKFPSSKEKNDIDLHITIYEQNSHVGGRLIPSLPKSDLKHELHAEDFATGGLARNSILASAAWDSLGLVYGVTGRGDERTMRTGFYNGRGVVSELPRPRSELGFGRWAALLWRYGLSVSYGGNVPTGTMKAWDAMLERAAKGRKGYESVWDILGGKMAGALGLGAMTRLQRNNIGDGYRDEVVRPQVRRQAGMGLEDISDLALSMALEREYKGTCVEGQEGNFEKVMKGFAESSKAELKLERKVTGLKRELFNETREMWVVQAIGSEGLEYEMFDHIVLAAPFNATLFPDAKLDMEDVLYTPAHLTFVSTKSAPKLSIGSGLDQILLIDPKTNIGTDTAKTKEINEITYIRDVFSLSTSSLVESRYLYRITASSPLSTGDVHALFGEENVDAVQQQSIENAWPVTMPRDGGDRGEFEIGKGRGLWGMGSGEGWVSSVDWMWVLGGVVGGKLGEAVEVGRERADQEG